MKKSKPNLKIWVALLLMLGLFAHVISLGQNNPQKNDSNITKVSELNKTIDTDNASSTEIKKDTEDAAAPSKKTGTGLFDLFNLGGPFMWPLLLFSILVIGVMIERTIVFGSIRFNVKKLGLDILAHLKDKNYADVVKVCDLQKNNVGCMVFQKSIPVLKKGLTEFEKAIETHSAVRVASLEKNLNILSTMGNIAPLTGFLGTVSGMITAFKTIALSDNVTARLVAGGIYEALITTAFGLIIAIVAVGANNIFVHKVDSFVNEMEETSSLISEQAAG